MSEMVERVRRAIIAADLGDLSDGADYEATARAAIAAMREPTEEMLDCGLNEASPGTTRDDMKEAWFAMVDEALK